VAGIEHDPRARLRAVQPGRGQQREQPTKTDDRDNRQGAGERDAGGPRAIGERPHQREPGPRVIATAAGIHASETVIFAGID
jgi:hypothetical protein